MREIPYIKTTVKAGRTIEIHKGYSARFDKHEARSGRRKVTPEEMQKVNEQNAARKLRRLINANFECGDYHLVLTYARDKRPDPKEANARITKFIRKLRSEYKKKYESLKYVHVTEYKTKAIHHHLVINDIDGINVTRIIRKLWIYGGTHFTPLDDTGNYRKLADYLIKETSKTFRERDGGHMQRYSCSRNLIKPVVKKEVIKRAEAWAKDPRPIKGYYVDKDSIENGIGWDGRPYQRYTLIQLEYERLERCG